MLRVSLCQRNKSKNIFTWYARIFDTETKEIRYESLGTTKKTEAHDLMLAKQAAGEFAKDLKSNMTLGKAFGLYLDDCETRGDTFEGKAHPHRFRHSFASALIKSGVNPKSLQKLLRHSNITTTLQIYSHVLEEDLAEDIEKMFTGH